MDYKAGGVNTHFVHKELVFGKCDVLEIQIVCRDMSK